jgi:CheY-like chemotaxis protein
MKGTGNVMLLVEDNPGDVRLVKEALRDLGYAAVVHAAADGEEAMAFLRRQGSYAEAPRPEIIVLDLNLPKKDGREVLTEIKADRELRRIPVVVLTTSASKEDILRAYDLHANCYMTKPVELQALLTTIRAIVTFWMEHVTLPPD